MNDKIKLYQFTPGWGLPNASPFCMKLETYLRMANLPYETVRDNDPRKAPKAKLPYIEADGKVMGDTTFIIEYLKQTRGDPLDKNLTLQQMAVATATQSLLEDHFYWVGVWSRWIEPTGWLHLQKTFFRGLPRLLRGIISRKVQKKMLAQLQAQGIGRHSAEEVIALGKRDINALATLLGDKAFLLGNEPTSIDACVFAFIGSAWFMPWANPLKAQIQQHENLTNYYQRMAQRYFPEMASSPKQESLQQAT